jgi:starch-binding outer membrane protein, SusD/RagB family
MKRIILPVVTLALLASSCVSLDETLITGVSSQYYATPDGLNSALIASYAQLRGFYGREQLGELTQLGTDTWMTGDQGAITTGMPGFDSYDSRLNSQVGELNNTWTPAYQIINNLNAALDRGPNTVGIPTATKNVLLGEAHFLRALQYFTLVQTFGDVTLSLHENAGVVVSAVRDPQSAVYAAIIADLDTAISQLPLTQADFGRATKGAAQTLRSKVYLTRAYKSFGTPATDFAQALADAKAVIASTTYALEDQYPDLWCVARPADPGRGGYCDITGYNQNRKEFIFTVQFSYTQSGSDVGGFDQYNYEHLVYLGQYDNGAAGISIARDLNNGRPFRRFKPTQYELSLWRNRFGGPNTTTSGITVDTRFDGSFQSVFYATVGNGKNPVGTANAGSVCGATPSPTPINSAPAYVACTSNAVVNVGDTTILYTTDTVGAARRLASKYTIRHTCPAGLADPSVYCGDNNGENNGYIGWDRYPSLKKFQDNLRTQGFNDQNGGKVMVLFRFAEVYLLAAEADLGLNNTTEAAAMINVLRVRAGHNNTLSTAQKADTAYVRALGNFTNVQPGQITLDFIMDERERELAGEFNRWFDMARPGPAYFTARVGKWNPKARPNIKATHILRPIPQPQIDGIISGPAYPQNPGY